jgi:hypothetical protein
MPINVFDPLGIRAEDERRRAIVAQRNALARQADPEAEQTPFRSGLSRVGAAVQNIPAHLLGTPRAETEFAPFSGTEAQQDELGPLREAALGARSSEEFAAILQRPDLFPDPAGPEGPILRETGQSTLRRKPGGGFEVELPSEESQRLGDTTSAIGFRDDGTPFVQIPSVTARQGVTVGTGKDVIFPDQGTGEFGTDPQRVSGPSRLTVVPQGGRLAETGTAPGSGTEPVLEGREVPVKRGVTEALDDLGNRLDPLTKTTQSKLETAFVGNVNRRERLQGILRAVTEDTDRLRIPARLADMWRRGLDQLRNPSPEEAASIKAMGRIRRRVNEELVLLVKEISGAQVSDKERQFIKTITTSLPSGPTELIGVLEDVIMMNDFATARFVIWDGAGRGAEPALIRNDQVQSKLKEEIAKTGTVMVRKGVDPERAVILSTALVEEQFGISPGGFDVMTKEFARGAPNFGQ